MARGTLRIYLGAAPGVGKTFAMLNEGRRRHERGTDVVVGFVETHGRPNTAEQIRDLEVIPRRQIDTAADVRGDGRRRHPRSQADGRARRRARAHERAGSRNEKRWQDVEELLDAGIDVISTVNIQHLESVNDVVERITGVDQQRDDPRRVGARGRPDRARRHDARGAASPHGPRQHLRPRRSTPRSATTSAWQPRRAARARAAVGRRPRRRGPPGVHASARHRRAVGDARTGRRGADRCAGRRPPASASRAHGHADEGDLLGVHVRPGTAGGPADGRSTAPALLDELGGSTTRSVGERCRRSARPVRPSRARHPARARREPTVAAGGAHAGSVINR